MIPIIIVNITMILSSLLACWGSFRLGQTMMFLDNISIISFDHAMRHIPDIAVNPDLDPYFWFMPLCPSFSQCMFSFRPLRLERWLDKDTIERIKS